MDSNTHVLFCVVNAVSHTVRVCCWGKRWLQLVSFMQTKPMRLKDSWSPRSFMHLQHVLPCHCMSSLQPSYLFCLWPFNRFPWHHCSLQSFAVCSVTSSIVKVSKRVINCMSSTRGRHLIWVLYSLCILSSWWNDSWISTHPQQTHAQCDLFGLQHWIRTIFRQMKYANEHLASGRHIWQPPPHALPSP